MQSLNRITHLAKSCLSSALYRICVLTLPRAVILIPASRCLVLLPSSIPAYPYFFSPSMMACCSLYNVAYLSKSQHLPSPLYVALINFCSHVETENAQSDTFKAPCCCFENAPYTALTIVCTINVSIDCKKNKVSNLNQKKNILDCRSR